jgi:ArsR family transcriptional regulator, arsenate/arsenite/antimonite-responsive transcriptional repressor
MGASKTDQFTDPQNQLALLAKALGHPARIAIIEYLARVESCICSDIVNELPLAQPTISQHLKELKNAGLIKGSVEGNSICYCIDPGSFDLVRLFAANIIEKENHKSCNPNTCC